MNEFLKRLLCLSIALPSVCSAREIEGYTPDAVVTYKKISDTELTIDIFYPKNHRKTDSTPAVVFFYAGGWAQGHPSQFHPQCEYLASRGMVAMSADYRVTKRDGVTPVECVKDAKSAMRWLRANVATIGIDPNRLAAGGGSAGGHIAAAAAHVSTYNEDGEDTSVSAVPSALLLFSAVVDNSEKGFGYRHVKDFWKNFSPLHNISKDAPPTIAFYGGDDKHAKSGLPERLKQAMDVVGQRCDLHVYEGQGHGFYKHLNSGFAPTLIKADEFLVSLGYLSDKPDPERIQQIESQGKEVLESKETKKRKHSGRTKSKQDATQATKGLGTRSAEVESASAVAGARPNIVLIMGVLLSGFLLGHSVFGAEQTRPNIIVIMADD